MNGERDYYCEFCGCEDARNGCGCDVLIEEWIDNQIAEAESKAWQEWINEEA